MPPETIAAATGPGGADRQRAFLAEDPARRALLAEDGGEAVGMAVHGPDRRAGGDAELYVIYVLPGHWSRGVGRLLMDRVIEDVHARGHARLALWVLEGNTRARRFYERYGFAVAGKKTGERHGHVSCELRYEREVR